MSFTLSQYNNPFEALKSLQGELERFWWEHSPFYDYHNLSNSTVFPSVNIFEENVDKLTLIAELPGMKKEDLAISIKEKIITIEGTRKVAAPAAAGGNVSYHRRERNDGRFSRTFRLPYPVKQDKIAAELKDGLLTINMEKSEEAKARQIAINS